MVLAFCRCSLVIPIFLNILVGRIINSLYIYKVLNKCPKCNKGQVFIGVIKLKDKCDLCSFKFYPEKIGDGASWITTFIICFLLVPILFYFEIQYGINKHFYIFIIFPLTLIISILLLRVFRYVLLKRYCKLL